MLTIMFATVVVLFVCFCLSVGCVELSLGFPSLMYEASGFGGPKV